MTFDGRQPLMEDDIFGQIRLNNSEVGEGGLWDCGMIWSHDSKLYSYFAAHSALRHFLIKRLVWNILV